MRFRGRFENAQKPHSPFSILKDEVVDFITLSAYADRDRKLASHVFPGNFERFMAYRTRLVNTFGDQNFSFWGTGYDLGRNLILSSPLK